MKTLQDLGWINNWKETPEIVIKCKEAKHKTINEDQGSTPGRGYNTVTICETCGYIYHCDSSD
jgi:hypothetical protein